MSKDGDLFRFIRALYGNAPEAAALVAVSGVQFTPSPYSHIGRDDVLSWLVSQVGALSRQENVWFGVCLQNCAAVAQGRRGKAQTAVAMPGLWFDLDCKGENHAESSLPSFEEAFEFIEGGPLGPPSIIVRSGGGLHAYWLFDHLWVFNDEADRERAMRLSQAFQLDLIRLAGKRGWALDNTSDLARLLRLPGTLNHKYKPPRPVELARLDERRRITVEDAEARVPKAKVGVPPAAGKKRRQRKGEREPDVEVILAGCPWLRHCVDDAESLPEPEWYAALSIVGRCQNGVNLAHEFSSPYPGYSPRETQYKLRRALTVAGPRTCRDIGGNLAQDNYCSNCDYRGVVSTPLQIGGSGRRSPQNGARAQGGTVYGQLPGA